MIFSLSIHWYPSTKQKIDDFGSLTLVVTASALLMVLMLGILVLLVEVVVAVVRPLAVVPSLCTISPTGALWGIPRYQATFRDWPSCSIPKVLCYTLHKSCILLLLCYSFELIWIPGISDIDKHLPNYMSSEMPAYNQRAQTALLKAVSTSKSDDISIRMHVV